MSHRDISKGSPETHCLVRGSINIDEFYHVPRIVRPGETISSTQYERRAGGKGANQAVAIAKAGGKVSLNACIGQDGMWIVDILKNAGVDTEGVFRSDSEPTGRAVIQVTPEGENCILLHRGANYVQRVVEPFTNTPFTHCLLLQNEIPLMITTHILSHAKTAKIITIFNPSPIPSNQELCDFPWKAVDWLVVNEGEARALVNAFSETLPLGLPPNDPQTDLLLVPLITQLRSMVKVFDTVNFVCTLGAAGVTIFLASGSILDIPALNVSGSVMDTTGAGDCFTGYFVAGLMEHGLKGSDLTDKEVERIATVAVKAAGICVQRPGAMESIPTRAEVLKS